MYRPLSGGDGGDLNWSPDFRDNAHRTLRKPVIPTQTKIKIQQNEAHGRREGVTGGEVPAPAGSSGPRWVRCRIRRARPPRPETNRLRPISPRAPKTGWGWGSLGEGGGCGFFFSFSLVSCAKAKPNWGGTSLPRSEAAKPKPETPPLIGGGGNHSLILD